MTKFCDPFISHNIFDRIYCVSAPIHLILLFTALNDIAS